MSSFYIFVAYFSLFAVAAVYKALTNALFSMWGPDNSVTTDETVEPCSPSHIAVLIHGTWARAAAWTLPASSLAHTVRSALGREVRFERFVWSGKNGFRARSMASSDLVSFIENLQAKYPRIPIFLIAHSHGGNIAATAMARLQRYQDIAGLACLSTPFLVAEERELGKIGRFASWAAPAAAVWIGVRWVGQVFEYRYYGDPIQNLILHRTEFVETTLPSYILVAASVASVVVGLWAARKVRLSSDDLIENLRYTLPSDLNLLILRTPGDEATSGINTITLLSGTVELIYKAIFDHLTEVENMLFSANKYMDKKAVFGLSSFFVSFLGGVLALYFASDPVSGRLSDASPFRIILGLIGSFLILFVAFRFLMREHSQLGLAYYKRIILAIALVPLIFLLVVFAIPIGPKLALSCLFVRVTVEASPFGTHSVTLVPSAFEHIVVPSGLKHSRTYECPAALRKLDQWLSSIA
jgi:pimeloyl-ACP methyl ester carboxylesterase